MENHDWLAERFEEHRPHLRGVAYRMLGSLSEADDAVQEAWLRLSRTDTGDVANLGGWLTTVVARVSLDMLRWRKSRREAPLDPDVLAPRASHGVEGDPEQDALLVDAVGPALLLVLDALAPTERLAFVLHDVFGVPFAEIAPIVGSTPAAARQLASRARRRVRGSSTAPDADRTGQREVVDAFLAAARNGDFGALLAVLDPDVVLRADNTAVQMAESRRAQGAPPIAPEMRGVAAVVETFGGRAQALRRALVNGAAGATWAVGGQPRVVFSFTIENGRITGIDMIAEPARLRDLDVVL